MKAHAPDYSISSQRSAVIAIVITFQCFHDSVDGNLTLLSLENFKCKAFSFLTIVLDPDVFEM
jgi:hypothetical protein